MGLQDGRNLTGEGTTAVAMKVAEGHVILVFPNPVAWLKLEPGQALEVAGGMIRAGMEARTGRAPGDVMVSSLFNDVKAQVSRELRDALVNRIILMRKTMDEQKRSPLYQAEAIVDRILSDTK